MGKYYERKELFESFILFDREAVERDFELNYEHVTSGDFEVGENEHVSAFLEVKIDQDGDRVYVSGLEITSILPKKLIDRI